MLLNVPVTFENVDDFKGLIGIAEKDHIPTDWKTADLRAQLRPWPPHETGQAGNVAALFTQGTDESPPHLERTAPLGNKAQNVDEIPLGTAEISQAWQLSSRSP